MANPRIEEVEDDDDFADDPEEMDVDDLDAFDFARPKGNLEPAMDPSASQINPADIQAMLQQQSQSQPQGQNQWSAQQAANIQTNPTADQQRQAQEQSKSYQCIYPVYFDSTRSKAEGRRVKKEDAVANPLAREIVDALSTIAQQKGVPLKIVFEPHKTHPKDWANPGRVRVLVKREGKAISNKIANKHYLYTLISSYLRAHPTTAQTPNKYRMQGMPPSKDGAPPSAPAIPRGFKIGKILPLHSPALSGGGVSDNFLKDMMGEMGGQLPPGMEGMAGMLGGMGGGGGGGGGPSGSGGQQKKVKDKKKK
ncbi:signal recognition particle subunit [Recurvomyces mirabilis]|nr:signal recognition particle subunit [Recurvomyces mirabilis]